MQHITSSGYSIYFNDDCYSYLQQLLVQDSYSKIFIIADENTSQHCLPNFLAQLATEIPIEIIEIEAGEINKNIETCTQVWHALTELGADRKSIVINVGGGVVTDLGGFAASTFKRGMDFVNVPTSLLAMVDASVGGKTGVDLGVLKNQIGIITNPVAVLIDTQFLETLPAAEMRSGLAEMLKHGLIEDEKYWNEFLSLRSLTTHDLDSLIYRSVQIKNEIVMQDPTEKGLRKILNFGHTLGHAIESYFLEDANKTNLLHGEAIAIGMILEAHISSALKLLPQNEYIQLKGIISSIFPKVEFTELDKANVIKLLIHDKKNVAGKVQFVLLERIGHAVINKEVDNQLIFNAFDDYLN
jgi:3-dehydroquinate synthase